MKRLFLSTTLVAVLALGMTSCKKDYTCDCKNGNGDQLEKTTYPGTKLIDAKRACDDREDVWKNTVSPSANCTIL